MSSSFLNEILQQLITEEIRLSQTTFILPSKRAGSFLRELLKTHTDYTGFAPEIISIEDFIIKITGLKSLDNTHSIFRFYDIYKTATPKEDLEDFETFYGWAQTLIYDFNEIDRYLIQTDQFFSYLSDIQEIEHWALAKPQSELVSNYLKFWRRIPDYHSKFVESLLAKKEAYQGLIYRQASKEIEAYLDNSDQQMIFVGFNALNNAEQKIIQTVLNRRRGRVFWDIDPYFLEDPYHETGLFISKYQNTWDYYKDHPLEGSSNYYQSPKDIEVIGISKNIGQAKEVGEILQKEELAGTAVVLNDEGLLIPLLNSLPKKVDKVNITMGLTLNLTPPASFFEILFKIQKEDQETLYYKNILEVITHPTLKLIFQDPVKKIENYLTKGNHVFVGIENLIELVKDEKSQQLLRLCFTNYKENARAFLNALIQLTQLLRPQPAEKYPLETEYLFHFNQVFKKMDNLINKFGSVSKTTTLHRLYKDGLQMESIDFEGSPFSGLQIMGMLETRALHYETVILTSVNEGILPSGKSTNSFIPYDLKRQYGLPTYREKDAVYTYHFYRLLQRAKKIYILYNTEKSGLNAGEKSRFITQLDIERPSSFRFKEHIKSQAIQTANKHLKQIPKSPEILTILKRQAQKGLSPSALTTYIRNPIDFYKNYVLGIKDPDLVEETIAAKTLGTVVHGVLENFYKPLEGKTLSEKDIDKMLKRIDTEVVEQFQSHYAQSSLNSGKNLIIKEIAQRFIYNFLRDEKRTIKNNTLRILRIESHALQEKIDIPELDFAVYLRGVVDRVDEINGQLRIVDYKTGKVEAGDLRLEDWNDLITNEKYTKAFQVLSYALMLMRAENQDTALGGIMSFKNRKQGFLNFEFKPEKKKDIDKEVLKAFENTLKILVLEILNPELPFIEKEIK